MSMRCEPTSSSTMTNASHKSKGTHSTSEAVSLGITESGTLHHEPQNADEAGPHRVHADRLGLVHEGVAEEVQEGQQEVAQVVG